MYDSQCIKCRIVHQSFLRLLLEKVQDHGGKVNSVMAKKLQSPSGLSAVYINTTYYSVAPNLYKHLWQELSINQMKTQKRPPSRSTDQQSLMLKDMLTSHLASSASSLGFSQATRAVPGQVVILCSLHQSCTEISVSITSSHRGSNTTAPQKYITLFNFMWMFQTQGLRG